MKITRAMVKNLHGAFSINKRFFDDYTFLHGINGTGKTSLLRAIQALTLPQLDWICLNNFSSIEVGISHENQKISFRCDKKDQDVVLKYRCGNDRVNEVHNIQRVQNTIKNIQRNYGSVEDGSDVVNNIILEIFSASEIIKLIQRLPSPIFLGLDRTAKLEREADRTLYERKRYSTYGANIFQDQALSQGISQAHSLIHNASRRYVTQKRIAENKLREEISFLMFPLTDYSRDQLPEFPGQKDVLRFRRMRMEIARTLEQIGYDPTRIERSVDPFFERIITSARKLSRYANLGEALEKTSESSEDRIHLYNWLQTQPVLTLIFAYFDLVENYNKTVNRARLLLSRFESIVNSFFADSGKNLVISEVGDLTVRRGNDNIQVNELSSGEKQILVLLTHLAFNPSLQKENVLIIDEPELSLHVRWQEIFVDSVMRANPNTQMILATHSPSIVLDRRDRMVSLHGA